jgi:hypothetical protein
VRRSTRIAIFALLLIGVVGGTALAARNPGAKQTPSLLAGSQAPKASQSADAPPTADELAHAADRLKAHDITVDAAQLKALSAKYGLGGAVRLAAWSKTTGKTVAEISAMRDAGKGWGQIGHELGVSSGIGSIMGNGHDASRTAKAAGAKDHGADADESPGPAESPGE